MLANQIQNGTWAKNLHKIRAEMGISQREKSHKNFDIPKNRLQATAARKSKFHDELTEGRIKGFTTEGAKNAEEQKGRDIGSSPDIDRHQIEPKPYH